MPKFRLKNRQELEKVGMESWMEYSWYSDYLDQIYDLPEKPVGSTILNGTLTYPPSVLIEIRDAKTNGVLVEDIAEPSTNKLSYFPIHPMMDTYEEPEMVDEDSVVDASHLIGDVEKEPTLTEQFKEFVGIESNTVDRDKTEFQLLIDDLKYAHLTFSVSCKAKDLSKRIEEVKLIVEATLNSGEEGKFLKARL